MHYRITLVIATSNGATLCVLFTCVHLSVSPANPFHHWLTDVAVA